MTGVLVVDHRDTDRELLVSVLGYAGYETLEAVTGAEALTLAHAMRPDLIVTDILTPTIDGCELVRELRSAPATSQIPLIFFAATYLVDEARRLATACGVGHMIVKPCAPNEILRVVGEALSSGTQLVSRLPSEEFHREYLRTVSVKLLREVEELRNVVVRWSIGGQSDQRARGRSEAVTRSPTEDVLTARELDVLAAIAEGATNREISERLVVAETTVQSHVKHILRKLGARNRTEAATRYVLGQLPDPRSGARR